MTAQTLTQFSNALAELALSARKFLALVRSDDGSTHTGVLWKANAVVVSEQALADANSFEVELAGERVKAEIAGRDPGTNVAVLKLERALTHVLPPAVVPRLGELALILGMSASDGTARLAVVRLIGGAWQSLAGGTIDRRITLDTYLAHADEGAAVLSSDGSIIGVAARGARRESLVIPASTVERAVSTILEKGGVERGWLGVSLHPVALPDSLRPEGAGRVGLMVMELVADGPAAKAGVLVGDILISAGGVAASRPGKIARQLGSASIGKKLDLTLARAGAVLTREATIEARKHV
jgi:S1-C subfamily serine protease